MKKLLVFICFISTVLYAEEDGFKKKVFKEPLREISVIVTDEGYYPNRIMAFEGERVRFYVTSTSKKGQCFILKNHEIFVSAEKGQVNEVEFIAEKTGRFKFYCPSAKFQGHLTVFEKADKVKEEVKRKVASEKPSYWLPRDYD